MQVEEAVIDHKVEDKRRTRKRIPGPKAKELYTVSNRAPEMKFIPHGIGKETKVDSHLPNP
jgi:hypothetical protein